MAQPPFGTPVDELLAGVDFGAVYYPNADPNAEGTLRITGRYKASTPVEFARFERVRFDGGLTYELRGLVYVPALETYTNPIPDHDTTIKLPNEATPEGIITIVTKDGNVPVEIKYVATKASPFPESNDAQVGPFDLKKEPVTGMYENVLLRASDLEATYYEKSETLRLNGKFTAVNLIKFARFSAKKNWVGGIAYEVKGFISGFVLKEYTDRIPSHDKSIKLPNGVVGGDAVVIFGADDQKTIVKINYLDDTAPPFSESDSTSSEVEISAQQQEPPLVGAQQANGEEMPPPRDTLLEGKDLTATYYTPRDGDDGKGTLVLTGKYTTGSSVSDARFVRLWGPGDFAFDVRGNVDWPAIISYTGDIKPWSEKLTLPPDSLVKVVRFYIAGGKQVVVPIKYSNLPPPKTEDEAVISSTGFETLLNAIESSLTAVYISPLVGYGTLVLTGEYTSMTLVSNPHFQPLGGLSFQILGDVSSDGVMPRPLPINEYSEGIAALESEFVTFIYMGAAVKKPIIRKNTFSASSQGESNPGFTQTGFQPVISQTGFQPEPQPGFSSGFSESTAPPVYSLLQASTLTAFYTFELGSTTGTLTVFGHYTSSHPVRDPHFQRKLDWVGGLAYNVEGIVDYPAILEITRPVNTLMVKMPLSDILPSKQVVFFTETGTETIPIDIIPTPPGPIHIPGVGTADVKQPTVTTQEIQVSEVN